MCTAHHLHLCLFLLIVLAVVTLWTLGMSYLYIISIICACCLACRSNCTCIDTTCCYMTWEHQTSLYCDMSIRDVPYHASCVIVQVLTWTTFEPLFPDSLAHTHIPDIGLETADSGRFKCSSLPPNCSCLEYRTHCFWLLYVNIGLQKKLPPSKIAIPQ